MKNENPQNYKDETKYTISEGEPHIKEQPGKNKSYNYISY